MKRVLLCAALLAWSGMAAAVVYKWTDAHGKILYGDRPPDGVHAEVVELPGSHATPSAPPPSPPKPASNSAPPPSTTTALNATEQDDAKKAVADDVAQTRDKQCADAQDRYKKLIEGRKLYKPGADGERQYLSSEEIDAERVNAKRDVDSICNSPT
jgi:hypothetical protein